MKIALSLSIAFAFLLPSAFARAEAEIVLLKKRPSFKPEQFIGYRCYKAALKALAREPGAKP